MCAAAGGGGVVAGALTERPALPTKANSSHYTVCHNKHWVIFDARERSFFRSLVLFGTIYLSFCDSLHYYHATHAYLYALRPSSTKCAYTMNFVTFNSGNDEKTNNNRRETHRRNIFILHSHRSAGACVLVLVLLLNGETLTSMSHRIYSIVTHIIRRHSHIDLSRCLISNVYMPFYTHGLSACVCVRACKYECLVRSSFYRCSFESKSNSFGITKMNRFWKKTLHRRKFLNLNTREIMEYGQIKLLKFNKFSKMFSFWQTLALAQCKVWTHNAHNRNTNNLCHNVPFW